jgi:hypothetical protein
MSGGRQHRPHTAPMLRVPDRAAYEAGRRSQGAALAMELVVPGLGSIYGDHWTGAAITWGMSVAGLALLWKGRNTGSDVLYTGLFETVFLTGGASPCSLARASMVWWMRTEPRVFTITGSLGGSACTGA